MTEAPRPVELVDLQALLAERAGPRVRWSASGQLQTNLVVLAPGEQVDEHVERELDVTLVVVAGELSLLHGRRQDRATAPAVVVLPAGTRRALTAGPTGAAYVTAHRRRPSLLPTVP